MYSRSALTPGGNLTSLGVCAVLWKPQRLTSGQPWPRYQAVLVTLLGDVARNYLELRGDQAQLAITRHNLAAQQDTRDLSRIRFQAGLSSELDVAQAEAQVATTASQIPALERQARQAIHRLGVLLGQEPGTLIAALSSTAPLPPPPPEVAVGLPAALLQRRPDIRRAERALAAATARIGVATAELYPRLALTGMLSLQSMQLVDLPQGASQSGHWVPAYSGPSLMLAVSEPIFTCRTHARSKP